MQNTNYLLPQSHNLFEILKTRPVDYDAFVDEIHVKTPYQVDKPEELTNINILSHIIPYQIFNNLQRLHYEKLTRVQKIALPIGFTDKDLLMIAQTGSGKSLCYQLPLLQYVMEKVYHFDKTNEVGRKLETEQVIAGSPNTQQQLTQQEDELDYDLNKTVSPIGLVIVPTRELAFQAVKQLWTLGFNTNIVSRCVFGRFDYKKQLKALEEGCDCLVATPGRLLDLINKKIIDISQLQYLVIDEVDCMLGNGFAEDIQRIIGSIGNKYCIKRFVSATMQTELQSIVSVHLNDPFKISVGHNVISSNIKQQFVSLRGSIQKQQFMMALSISTKNQILVFCNSKKSVCDLTYILSHAIMDNTITREFNNGYCAQQMRLAYLQKLNRPYPLRVAQIQQLYGEMSVEARLKNIEKFKKNGFKMLITTDLMQRGVDLPNVDLVVNYDIPSTAEDLQHRVGRCGRAGREGIIFNFLDTTIYQNYAEVFRNVELPQEITELVSKNALRKETILEHTGQERRDWKGERQQRKREKSTTAKQLKAGHPQTKQHKE